MKKIDIYSDTSAYVIGSLGFLIFLFGSTSHYLQDGDFWGCL